MKINFIIGAALVMFTMSACNKNELPTNITADTVYCDSLLDNPESVFYGLNNPDDDEDDMVNKIELKIALTLNYVISQNYSFKQALLDTSNYDIEGGLNLIEFASNNPGFESEFDAILVDNSYCILPELNTLQKLDSALIYAEVDYFPAIYFYNKDTATSTDKMYILVGQAINEDDEIPGFRHENDSIFEHKMNVEEDETSFPVLIVTHSTNQEINIEPDSVTFEQDSSYLSRSGTNNFDWKMVIDEMKIKAGHRYEQGNSKSEITLSYVVGSYSYGPYISGYTSNSLDNLQQDDLIKPFKKVRQVTKAQVDNSTNFTSDLDFLFLQQEMFSYSSLPVIGVVVYEHDGYCLRKRIKRFILNSYYYDMNVKMKYVSTDQSKSNHYLLLGPIRYNYENGLHLEIPNGGIYTVNNSTCTFKFKRII